MRKLSITALLITVYQFCCLDNVSAEITVAVINKLSSGLLQGYNKNTLPAANFSQQFEVHIKASLISLGDLDEVEEKFSSVILFVFQWNDVSMRWNPDEYEGVDNISMSYHDVWKPTLLLVNPHEAYAIHRGGQQMETAVGFDKDGNAFMMRLMTLQTSCDLDTTFFPFDTQSCNIHLFLAENSGYAIRMNALMEDYFTEHKENGAWFLTEETIEGDNNSNMVIKLKLKRKPKYELINIILPILVLAFLTPLVFIMPKSSGERIGYSVTMLLAISVYMSIISDHLPEHADPVPMVTIMIFVWYMLNSTIVLVVILNIKVNHVKDKRPVPLMLRRLVIHTRRIRCKRRLHSGISEEKQEFLTEADTLSDDEKNTKNTSENQKSKDHVECLQSMISDVYFRLYPDGVTWAEVSVAVDNWALVWYYFLILLLPILFMIIMHCKGD